MLASSSTDALVIVSCFVRHVLSTFKLFFSLAVNQSLDRVLAGGGGGYFRSGYVIPAEYSRFRPISEKPLTERGDLSFLGQAIGISTESIFLFISLPVPRL